MIKLMELTEVDTIMDMWSKEMKNITGLDKEIDSYAQTVEDAFGHANVYVFHSGEDISGFAAIMEGFFISDLVYKSDETGKSLILELKKRYDELQTDLHHNHKANTLLPKLGITKLEGSTHDVLGFNENGYEWLRE